MNTLVNLSLVIMLPLGVLGLILCFFPKRRKVHNNYRPRG